MNPQPVFRFAPSPNGFLHLGHIYSALTTYNMARHLKGRFLLRLEDIDIGRTREEFIEAIYQDLQWMGIEWELPVRKQSEHFDDYKNAMNILLDNELLYPCFATRKEIADAIALKNSPVYPLDPDGSPLYPEICKHWPSREINRRMEEKQPFAYRLDMNAALAYIGKNSEPLTIQTIDHKGEIKTRKAEPQRWGDTVIMRKDTPTSYHLSVVWDDALQGITHVTRGQDLEAATDLHRLLQTILELPSPIYYHHNLLKDEEGQKLAKSKGSKSIQQMRKEGMKPDDVLNLIQNQNS